MFDGVVYPTPGFLGGEPGAPGAVRLSSGRAVHPKRETVLRPGEVVLFDLPGGGGFGPVSERRTSASP
jgi:N-methylhydantoinase B